MGMAYIIEQFRKIDKQNRGNFILPRFRKTALPALFADPKEKNARNSPGIFSSINR
jgi:hypothetical protein